MFDFFRKGHKLKLGEEKRSPRSDDFPSYELLEEITIIDIRDKDDIKYYGYLSNSINIPFDSNFYNEIKKLDKNKKYGIMDLRGNYIQDALEIAKKAGINAVEIRGGFFYLTEVMNIKPIKER